MDQSNVLDEVDQLVDLMTAEKAVLTQKLTKLEVCSFLYYNELAWISDVC